MLTVCSFFKRVEPAVSARSIEVGDNVRAPPVIVELCRVILSSIARLPASNTSCKSGAGGVRPSTYALLTSWSFVVGTTEDSGKTLNVFLAVTVWAVFVVITSVAGG